MKKILLYIIIGAIGFTSCKSDSDEEVAEVVSIDTQNSYDDQAAVKFLKESYFDPQGKIVAFSATDTSDDNFPSLYTYNPVTLPSGVIVVKRPSAEPIPGKAINDKDILRLTSISSTFVAKSGNEGPIYSTQQNFRNTIMDSGVPEVDPSYFYTKNAQLNGKDRSYYEIEGFQEGIKQFKSCEIADGDNYNMQGVIIVPSRAAFARDSNVYDIPTANGGLLKFVDRSFVFNVQVYKTTTRTAVEF